MHVTYKASHLRTEFFLFPHIFIFLTSSSLLPSLLLSKHGAGAEFGVKHEGLSAHQGKFPCLSGARSAASPSINPIVNTANTQTHIHIHISPTNREVSLQEAAAVTGVTAVLKSGTLVPVNSNLGLRLPLSHSVQTPQTHTYTHSPTQRRRLRRRWCVLSGAG